MDRHYRDAATQTDPVLSNLHDGFDQIDAAFDRLDKKIDAWFNLQYLLMVLLGVLILFDDEIRGALGL